MDLISHFFLSSVVVGGFLHPAIDVLKICLEIIINVNKCAYCEKIINVSKL